MDEKQEKLLSRIIGGLFIAAVVLFAVSFLVNNGKTALVTIALICAVLGNLTAVVKNKMKRNG